jgi:hypothetical protein
MVIIKLVAYDKSKEDISIGAAKMSDLIKYIVEEFDEEDLEDMEIPLQGIENGEILKKVVYFMEGYFKKEKTIKGIDRYDDLSNWDKEYVYKIKTEDELVRLINASVYLDIPDLLNLLSIRLVFLLNNKLLHSCPKSNLYIVRCFGIKKGSTKKKIYQNLSKLKENYERICKK